MDVDGAIRYGGRSMRAKNVMIFSIVSIIFLNILCGGNTMGASEMTLTVNENNVINKDLPLIYNEQLLLPLRSIFESLGARVTWYSDTGKIMIEYAGEVYICKFWYAETVDKFMTVESSSIDNGALGHYIQLEPMSGSGAYEMINDRTYLYEETGRRLFEALGCTVEIDKEQKVVRITSH